MTAELERDLKKKTDEITEGNSYGETNKHVLGQISIHEESVFEESRQNNLKMCYSSLINRIFSLKYHVHLIIYFP